MNYNCCSLLSDDCLEFHLVNHFLVDKNLTDFFLNSFVGNGLDAGDGGAGIIRFVLQIINNTGYSGKTDTTGAAAGTVQHSTTNIIEDGLFLKPDSTFLQKGILPADGGNFTV